MGKVRKIETVYVDRLTSTRPTLGVSTADTEQGLKDALQIIASKYPNLDPLVIEIIKNHQGLVVAARLKEENVIEEKETKHVNSRSESAEQLHMRALWEEVSNDPPLSGEEEARRQTDSM